MQPVEMLKLNSCFLHLLSALQGIFQDLEHGGVNQPLGSLRFPSPLLFPFPLPPLPLSPSFPPEAGGCHAKVGGVLTPPEGVWETPWCIMRSAEQL